MKRAKKTKKEQWQQKRLRIGSENDPERHIHQLSENEFVFSHRLLLYSFMNYFCSKYMLRVTRFRHSLFALDETFRADAHMKT